MAEWGEIDITVTFSDGRTETVRLSLAARMAVERKWPGVTTDAEGKLEMRSPPGLESAAYATWLTLGKPGAGDDDDAKFDAWSSTLVSLAEVDTDTVPTEPAAGDA